jgi:hypothetical protein
MERLVREGVLPSPGTAPSTITRQVETRPRFMWGGNAMGGNSRMGDGTMGMGLGAGFMAQSGGLGNQTTGLDWGVGGGRLYVGTEVGVYEFVVDVGSRKVFPSVRFR